PPERPLRGPRLGRRAPRPAPGRGLKGPATRGLRDAPRGLFITVEGLDFSGKSTLVRTLRPLLSDPPTHFTREPGGTPAAERIRELVLEPGVEMDAWAEAYLYAAARADHARLGILPRLEAGENVLCERYLDSSIAYQGFGRGLGAEAVRALNAFGVGTIMPDRTFYLRLDPAERERRAERLGAPPDRIESVGAGFMRRVEEGFEELTRLEPGRIEVLDASRPPHELAELVVGRVRDLQYTRGDGG
ncbi:MAG: dTMP kinase, partial [Actinomycetota bacterium]|nr:dTMP kinase [Actinomycetota bacterium]